MTPEERDRLARVEQQMTDTRDDISEIKVDVKALVASLNISKGRASVGTLMLIFAGGALTWVLDHVVSPLIRGS